MVLLGRSRGALCSALVRNPFASPLWRNQAFVRVWSAATISIFGSLITRIALPLVAILVLGSGALEVALLRGLDLGATLVFGLVAGAWVDRLRRRPVLIWADLGRAALLGSVPVAFALGVLSFPQLLVVSGLAAILTTFFDAADNAYLPTVVERDGLVEANSALAASGSAAEFMAFGISGFLVQILTAPIAIAIDAVTYLASALLLGTIRQEEAPPPKPEDREPVLAEIRVGLRLVRHDPILRAFVGAQMALAALWGIFGATWFLFVLDDLELSPAVLGVVAGVGGASSFIGAVVATRATGRWGVGTGGDRGDAAGGGRQRVHPARAGRAAAHRHRLPRHAAAGRRLGGHRLRHHRGVRPPDARPRPGARAGGVDVQGRGDGRAARRDAGGRAAGRGHRPARDVLAGAARRAARRGDPVVLAGPPPASRCRRRSAAGPPLDPHAIAVATEMDQPPGA